MRHGERSTKTRRTDAAIAAGLLLGTVLTAAGDLWVVDYFTARVKASFYAATPGRLLECRVDVRESFGMLRSTMHCSYAYGVEGVSYVGHRYRPREWRQGDEARLRATVDSLRVCGNLWVYYRPTDPTVAVLQRDWEARDFALPLMLLPPNLLAGLGWCAVVRERRWRRGAVPAGGFRVRREGARWCVRLAEEGPWTVATTTLLLAGLAAALLEGLVGMSEQAVGPEPLLGVWGLLGALTANAFFATRRRERTGMFDLLIDEWQGTVRLPPSPGRESTCRLSIQDLAGVGVRHESAVGPGGARRHVVFLKYCDPTGLIRRESLLTSQSRRAAHGLAAWLRARLGVRGCVRPAAVVRGAGRGLHRTRRGFATCEATEIAAS